jgi:predicted transposase/invertase (TIGR01784 family)
MKAKYINLFTDFGFKKIFGEEASKPLLVDFLNSLLPEINIVALNFKDKEQLGRSEEDRKAIYDLYCEDSNGKKIIVELQRAKQNYFKDRTIYYSSFPIQEQAERGNWNYELKAVYCVGILDFTFDEKENAEVIHTVQLKNQNNQVFYDKLKYVYLELPNFKKAEHDLNTRLDKWLYFIKNLENFDSIPAIFKDEVFSQAFEKAEIAKYDDKELDNYQQSLKIFRDNQNTFSYAMDNAFIEGKIKGKLEGKLEVAKSALMLGLDIENIMKLTQMTELEILNIKNNL